MAWISSGRITNPAVDAVLLDTGPVVSGTRSPQVMLSSTVAAGFELQWRDAANLATLKSQMISCTALDTKDSKIWSDIEMATNERLRVLAVGLIVGTISVSMFYQP